MNESLELVLQYARDLWRYRWWAVFIAWLVSIVGAVTVAMLPDVYEASTRVYVDTSSELRKVLGEQITESDVDDQLALVREAIVGKTQLRDVASKTGLYGDAQSETEKVRVVDALSRQIVLTGGVVGQRGRQDHLYSIKYQHSDSALAKDVVETLLETFVENSLGAKRTSSEAAGKFLKDQIAEYEDRLRHAEERLAEFNRQHFDRLPSMQGGYFQRLQAATEQLATSRQDLRLAESRLQRIDQQIRGEAPRVATPGEVNPDSLEGRIAANKAQLDQLLLKYTDSHPDVVATRENIAMLEKRRQQADTELLVGGGLATSANNPVFQALQISHHELETEIASLEVEVAERSRRVSELRGLINEMPEVEAELARLNRDYDVVYASYQSLLNSLEREQLSRNVFQTEQIDFRVIDPPAVSLDPVAPRRAVLLWIAFIASLAGGGLFAFILSQLKPVYRTSSELVFDTDLPVLGSVGQFLSEEGLQSERREMQVFSASMVSLVIVFLGFFFFEILGPGLRGFVL